MAWNLGFINIATNLGINIEIIILIIVVLGGLIFYYNSVRRGLIMHFIMCGVVFMGTWGLYNDGLDVNFIPSLILMFIFLALTLLSLFFNNKQGGGII